MILALQIKIRQTTISRSFIKGRVKGLHPLKKRRHPSRLQLFATSSIDKYYFSWLRLDYFALILAVISHS